MSRKSRRRGPGRAAEYALSEREAAVLAREQALAARTLAADQRERSLLAREEALDSRFALSANAAAQLREANERLVVATVGAQELTEVAQQAIAQVSFIAEHDFVTGLPNRVLLLDRLRQSIALAQRHGRRTALLYIDLDHFKHVNDSLGHSVGDQLLKSVANRLQACVRSSDTVSRQGGDEFVVLLAEVGAPEDVAFAAEKLIKATAEPHLVGNDERLHVTLSIGISLYPDDARDVDSLIQHADAAMYVAKRNGRNTYRLFTSEMAPEDGRGTRNKEGGQSGDQLPSV